MKIYDIMGPIKTDPSEFSDISTYPVDGHIPGTRFRRLAFTGFSDYANVGTGSKITRTLTGLTFVGYGYGNVSTTSYQATGGVSARIMLPDLSDTLAAADSIVTIGFNVKTPTLTAISLVTLVRLVYDTGSIANLLSTSDLTNPSTTDNYVEIVVNRKTGVCKIYVNDVIKSKINLGAIANKTNTLTGFDLGSYWSGTTGSSGNRTFNATAVFKDFYLAEFTREDGRERLGPQRAVGLDVSAINATTWTDLAGAAPTVGALNDTHAAATDTTIGNTSGVLVNDTDPVGALDFTGSGVGSSQVNGLSITVDALTGDVSSADFTLLKGSDVVASNRLALQSAYTLNATPLASGWSKLAIVKTFPKGVAEQDLLAHKLQVKAVAG